MSEGGTTDREDLPRILLVDDEDQFRVAMAKQLSVRGYRVLDVNNGADAIKLVRHKNPEVVVLDQKMPKMDGIQTLKELKKIRPEIQVIMLTGHGSIESARQSGKHDVFHYLQKPCGIDELVDVIEAGRQERVYAMARHEVTEIKKTSLKEWLNGQHNARPGLIILGFLIFLAISFMPAPQKLTNFLSTEKSEAAKATLIGYSDYRKMKDGQNIAQYYSEKAGLYNKAPQPDGTYKKTPLTVDQTAFRAKVMVGTLVMCTLFWATGAIPIGMTALLAGAIMYFFGIFPAEKVAASYAKDSVIFVFGVLTIASALGKTGLDRRIGLVLLGQSTSIKRFAFLFCPMLAVTAAFLSEHALVAFITPVLIMTYAALTRAEGIRKDRNLAVMLLLMLTFAANAGGPGSPAAGGRNAVMLGILSDYGITVSFSQWVKMGLPTVPVLTLGIGLYFYFVFGRRLLVKHTNIAAEVRKESDKIGRMTRQEYMAAAILIGLILMWITLSEKFGMGGPVLVALVLFNLVGVLRWKDISEIHWDVVALYACASAIGAGLAVTGAALWMADSFVSLLPDFLRSGNGLIVSASLITGVLTNFMSDGATVAAVGPITVPMAALAEASAIKVGLATAFASSFANMFIVGTPNNAIVYAMAKDPDTGEQLVTMKDFLIHGSAILVINFVVLWFWTIYGYWRFFDV